MLKKLFIFAIKKLNQVKYAKIIGVKVGRDCRLLNCDFSTEPYLIEMGDHVSATKVRFETHDGGVWVIRDKYKNIDVVRPIKIGNNVYIGYGAVIMPGVSIGDNSVIGAYSVVTKNVPSGCVFAGIPAKHIKSIDEYTVGVLEKSEDTKAMSFEEKKLFYKKKFG